MTMFTTIALPALIGLSLSACGTSTPEGAEGTVAQAPAAGQQPEKAVENENEGLFAKVETTKGTITLKLEFEKAPMTVANFVGLAEGKVKNTAKPEGTPYFNGIVFHRVIPGFMVQCGDPTGTGMGHPGYTFADEIHPELRHHRAGTLSMANSGPATNGSQFFITNGPTPHLDGRHAVFGYVTTGQDVVDAIAASPRDARDRPLEEISIVKVTIERVGAAAKAFDATKVLEANAGKFKPR